MLTYRNIVDKLQQFATSHANIRTFTSGHVKNMDREKYEEYPVMHALYTGADYADGVKTYGFEIYLLDPPEESTPMEQQNTIVSNMEIIAEDLLSEIARGTQIFTRVHGNEAGYALASASTEAMFEETSNAMCGVKLNISINVARPNDVCFVPYV